MSIEYTRELFKHDLPLSRRIERVDGGPQI